MSSISRNVLFSKLNSTLYKAVESAYSYCRFRENTYVELAHWLHILLQEENNDLNLINQYFQVQNETLKKDVLFAIEHLPSGATSVADISKHIEQAVEQSWTYSSLLFNSGKIRGGHLIYSIIKSVELSNVLFAISNEFRKIKVDTLSESLSGIIKDSVESQYSYESETTAESNASEGDSALKKYGTNLTEMAREGKIDPIIGRDNEIRQMIDILMRRRQNNPILTGEAGVGKTAVVEGLALKLASGDVPDSLKNIELVLLDIGSLKAGASVSGEFETRLKSVMTEVESSTTPIVLFIDEIHTLIGAGGAAGTADAANLLKPALARGKLRTIGATTWAEYKKYFEKDPALTRRFQMIQIDEPQEDKAIEMLRALIPSLEKHHNVLILDDAIVASVQLSHRYIPARQLPDKAISLIDTACARVALSQNATPSSIEYLNRNILSLQTEQKNLQRELQLEYDQSTRIEEITNELSSLEEKLATAKSRWQEEKNLVKELQNVRKQLLSNLTDIPDVDVESNINDEQVGSSDIEDAINQSIEDKPSQADLISRQSQLIEQLKELQKDNPMVLPLVNAHAVADVVSDWTGIPVGKMMKDELKAVLELSETLSSRVIDQEHGINEIAKRIQTSRANLDDPNKPIGVFMLAGPSGVGKTETALALADSIYGGEHNVITINMSEYQEAHTVSTLKGAPPGYVGYGEGGVLTEAVRRKPYSVVLLDEIEKAHPDVHEVFFQVFDKGWMEDGEGRYIDFKNTIIILTTNVGTDLIMDSCYNNDEVDLDKLQKDLRKPLLSVFPAALLGRIQVIPYYPLSDSTIVTIIKLQLEKIVKRIDNNHGILLSYSDEVLDLLSSRCQEVESGGRMIDAILTNSVLPEISKNLLTNIIEGKDTSSIYIDVVDSDLVYNYS